MVVLQVQKTLGQMQISVAENDLLCLCLRITREETLRNTKFLSIIL